MAKFKSITYLKSALALIAGASLIRPGIARADGEAVQNATGPLVTDRPDFTESADTIAPGRIQVESGFTFERSGDERAQSFGEVLVRIPVGGRSELRIGVPSFLRVESPGSRDSGFDDLSLGAKWTLKKGEGMKPTVAVLAGTSLPTGSRRVAERRYQPEVKLAASVDFSDKWSLAANGGYVRASSEGQRFDQFLASLSLGYSINDRWGSYFEVYGFNRSEPGGSSEKFFNTGLTYLINNDFQLDARVGTGLNGNDHEYFWGLGASRRF